MLLRHLLPLAQLILVLPPAAALGSVWNAVPDPVDDIMAALTLKVRKLYGADNWFPVSAMLCATNPLTGGGSGCQMAGIPVVESLGHLRGVEAVFCNVTGADHPTVMAIFDAPSGNLQQQLNQGDFVGDRMFPLPLGNRTYITATEALAAVRKATNYSRFDVLSVVWPLNPCVSEPLFIFSMAEPSSPTGFAEVFVGSQTGAVCRTPVTRRVIVPTSCERDQPKCWVAGATAAESETTPGTVRRRNR